MKKTMLILTAGILTLFALSLVLYGFLPHPATLAVSISFGTTAYHFVMRLAVGLGIQTVFQGKMNYRRRWFRERSVEPRLYRFLRVKAWKKFIPTFDASQFNLKIHTMEELLSATCQAEIVHEIIILLSFLPLVMICFFGEPSVFIITSLCAALIDSIFVILQRFNRPRLFRLLK